MVSSKRIFLQQRFHHSICGDSITMNFIDTLYLLMPYPASYNGRDGILGLTKKAAADYHGRYKFLENIHTQEQMRAHTHTQHTHTHTHNTCTHTHTHTHTHTTHTHRVFSLEPQHLTELEFFFSRVTQSYCSLRIPSINTLSRHQMEHLPHNNHRPLLSRANQTSIQGRQN